MGTEDIVIMKLSENLAYLRYFGVNVTFYKTLHRLNKNNGYLTQKNTQSIENFLLNYCITNSFDKLRKNNLGKIQRKNLDIKINSTIWTLWWQGENKAPYIVKKCIQSMREHANGHKVVVIDQFNYKDYIDIPNYVLDRYKKGQKDKSKLKIIVLSNPSLSDIIRCGILATYGGVWADATIFFSKDIDKKIFERNWYTLGQDDKTYVGQGKWSSFFFECQKDNPLIKFVFLALCEYWKNEKYYINYLMVDYVIDIAYKYNTNIATMINESPNSKSLTINRNYNEIMKDEKKLDNFIKNQRFHKLSYKWWIDGNKPVEIRNGKKTIYGFLKEKYFRKLQ